MEKATLSSTEIPTALPGFEDDDARERLLLEDSSSGPEETAEEEVIDGEETALKLRKRRRHVVRAFAAFAIFLCVLIVGIAWFFGMGWFSRPKTEVVNRTGNQKDAQTSAPATEDEKMKMALSMVAPTSSAGTVPRVEGSSVPVDTDQGAVPTEMGSVSVPRETIAEQDAKTSIGEKESYSLPLADKGSAINSIPINPPKAAAAGSDTENVPRPEVSALDEARGRSLFFGIARKQVKEDETSKPANTANQGAVSTSSSSERSTPARIPFGTLLPVRLVGSIYTLRNSGGHVRMELTRPVEGDGYSYPAGTLIVGEVRGGESVKAFVGVVGLIDPISGEFVKFNGELLGRDGSSGIEGRRRNLTSQWSRFFRGMKDTAASVLGSVGAFRSGGTVILSEPIRRGTESMSEDLSGAILKNDREDTFLEVAAGSSGYVLVTGLPENSTSAASKTLPEAAKE